LEIQRGCAANSETVPLPKKRLLDHNRGDSPHTARFTPWELIAYFAFREKEKATAFEKYLKSGSGRAFAKRHFIN